MRYKTSCRFFTNTKCKILFLSQLSITDMQFYISRIVAQDMLEKPSDLNMREQK